MRPVSKDRYACTECHKARLWHWTLQRPGCSSLPSAPPAPVLLVRILNLAGVVSAFIMNGHLPLFLGSQSSAVSSTWLLEGWDKNILYVFWKAPVYVSLPSAGLLWEGSTLHRVLFSPREREVDSQGSCWLQQWGGGEKCFTFLLPAPIGLAPIPGEQRQNYPQVATHHWPWMPYEAWVLPFLGCLSPLSTLSSTQSNPEVEGPALSQGKETLILQGAANPVLWWLRGQWEDHTHCHALAIPCWWLPFHWCCDGTPGIPQDRGMSSKVDN